ncbi:MAG TPA: lysophospholipid acyltransferase family protein [Tepidisphaeraceae bacterium]|jgi:1-acyl-sn-glycerol-3-phosphate acyltransferase|nr:lysophospholipid acyltransferase family protein [Tepidisphaeraceae bacterium]
MSDPFYKAIRFSGRHVFWLTSNRRRVIGAHHAQLPGPYILAATHGSPYDIPLLILHTKRNLDFVSSAEVFKNRFVAWFYGSMNAFPLDRSRPDTSAVRIILDRLKRGRAVAMFPEGRICKGNASVVFSRRIRPGIGRIAQLANVPIVPVVIVNSIAYSRVINWLPLKRVRYGLIYGPPIAPEGDAKAIEQQLIDAYVALHAELIAQMPPAARDAVSSTA